MNTTVVRTLTALTLVGVVGTATAFGGKIGFSFSALICIIGMQTEYVQLTFKGFPFSTRFFIATIYFALTYVVCFLSGSMIFWETLTLSGVFGSSLLIMRLKALPPSEQFKYHSLFYLGFFYVGLLPSLVIQILDLEMGSWLLLSCFIVVFSTDIFAYFVGRKWGVKKLHPVLSPKKSWAGAWGGLVGSFLCGLLILWALNINMGEPIFPRSLNFNILFLGCCIFASVASQMGDLFESMIKRAVDEKDSGRLLPGHGGFLDRFDALMFGLPFFYWLAKFFN